MRKIFIIFVLFLFSINSIFAYSIKVYDEYGNRVGTYRKEGDKYQFYDFNENKVDHPEAVIKNVPTDKTLTEYSQTFYDENMMPIGTWRSGYFGNDGRYYPRGVYYPTCFYKTNTPQIVRPRAGTSGYGSHPPRHGGTYYVDTRFPRFHKF